MKRARLVGSRGCPLLRQPNGSCSKGSLSSIAQTPPQSPWPLSASSASRLFVAAALLPADARRCLEGQEDGDVADVPRPYWDPVLDKNAKQYRAFIQRLNILRIRLVFSLSKSDRKKMRLIVDARSTNAMFKDPPGVDLCSSEGFSRIEVEVSEELRPGSQHFADELQKMGLYVGPSDVKDCFHRLRQPKWLAEYFCFKPVRAHWVGMSGATLDGTKLTANDWIYPMPGSLCMGFSWSLYFAQKINEYQCHLTHCLKASSLISHKGEPVVFRSNDFCNSTAQGTRL